MRRHQLEADDPDLDQPNAGEPGDISRLSEERHTEQGRPDRAHASPDGISRAERQAFQRQPKQSDADDH